MHLTHPVRSAVSVLLAITVAASLGAAGPSASARAPTGDPTRIMVVGDSVAHGSTGDYTWRYRLWSHLRDDAVPVDLVGPHTALHDLVTDTNDNQDYAVAGFDQDHAARWGMTLGFPDEQIGDLVDDYHPDVIVEMLGLNDLLFLHLTTQELLDQVSGFISRARSADPGVDVVVGSIPQTWYDGVTAYNAGLQDLVAGLDTPGSRVVAAAVPAGFSRERDTWDNTHPSATGEVAIAGVVADALAGIGIGTPYVAPSPPVVNGPVATATSLTVVPADGQVSLTWANPVGHTGEILWSRDATAGASWSVLDRTTMTDTTHTVTGLVNGHDYQFRLQAFKGTAIAVDRFSEVVTARLPRPTQAAVPESAPTPLPQVFPTPSAQTSSAVGRPRLALLAGHRVRVSWPQLAGASRYVVERRRAGGWIAVGSTTVPRLRTRPLPSGRQVLRVSAFEGASLVGRSPKVRLVVR